MERIVDITTDGAHLSVVRGFLKVSANGEELGRVPLDDIAALIIHAHGATFSANLADRLSQRGALMVLCGPNHQPHAIMWPLQGHHAQGARMRAQWAARKPLHKRLWQQIVQAKVRMQGAVLTAVGEDAAAFGLLARRVRSGDPDNVEAQAARRYWPLLMGPGFRRDRNAGGANNLLNYGYTVLRSAVSRAIVAAGLHPTIGLHHHNQFNAFALADDLMEPFRPLVDMATRRLWRQNPVEELEAERREMLVRVLAFDLKTREGRSPLSVCIQRLAVSLAHSFEQHRPLLEFPALPTPLELKEL